MAETSPIPVRLSADTIRRLDETAAKLGNTRAGVIKLCLTAFLEAFEATGTASLPLDWEDVLRRSDGRTRSHRAHSLNQAVPTQHDACILPNDSVISTEPVHVTPLSEIGPEKGQLAITPEAHLASLEAQLRPEIIQQVIDLANAHLANRALDIANSGEEPRPTIQEPPPAPASRQGSKKKQRRRGRATGKG